MRIRKFLEQYTRSNQDYQAGINASAKMIKFADLALPFLNRLQAKDRASFEKKNYHSHIQINYEDGNIISKKLRNTIYYE